MTNPAAERKFNEIETAHMKNGEQVVRMKRRLRATWDGQTLDGAGHPDYQYLQHTIGFATAAYALGTQPFRKYTGEPYVVHPIEVACILREECGTEVRKEALQAAILHDIIEDTPLTYEIVLGYFGAPVADAVLWLSDTEFPDGERPNRKERKRIDRDKIGEAPGWVQSIKVADLISNTKSIVPNDPTFAVVYLKEKAMLLEVLTEANSNLLELAVSQVTHGETALLQNALGKMP